MICFSITVQSLKCYWCNNMWDSNCDVVDSTTETLEGRHYKHCVYMVAIDGKLKNNGILINDIFNSLESNKT